MTATIIVYPGGRNAYEPELGSPTVDGYALVSTIAGVRSWTAVGGTPGGATTQVQYNLAGAFAGAASFTYVAGVGLNISDTTASTSYLNGALVLGGGLGIAGAINQGLAVAASSVDGIVLATTATATAGAQKFSPALHFTGSGWGTTGGAAQAVDVRVELQPIQGATNPTHKMVWSGSINGGAYSQLMALYANAGQLDVSYGVTVNGNSAYYIGSQILQNVNGVISWSSTANALSVIDTYLKRFAAANLQLGDAAAAAPVAQTLSVQDVVAGTTDTAGANWTFRSSRSTGTGAGGGFIWQISPPAGSTATTQNTAVQAAKLIYSTDSFSNLGFALRVGGESGVTNPGYFQTQTNGTVRGQFGSGGIWLDSTAIVRWSSGSNITGTDTYLGRNGAAGSLKWGGDSATPQAYTFSHPDGSGTNIAGANTTYNASRSTGSGAGGKILFRTADGVDLGATTLQALTTKLEISPTGLGFNGTASIAKPTVSGSRGANAALASALTALANYGLITDSSTA